MNQPYGGLVTIINYAGQEEAAKPDFLITQSGIDILTQASENILVQAA